MKVKQICNTCDNKHVKSKITTQVTFDPKERDQYFEFAHSYKLKLINEKSPNVEHLFMAPSKYPKSAKVPLVIPNADESPCGHCQFGEETIGPGGCGRADTCLALAYHNVAKTNQIGGTLNAFFKNTKGWVLPRKKYTSKAIGKPIVDSEFTSFTTELATKIVKGTGQKAVEKVAGGKSTIHKRRSTK